VADAEVIALAARCLEATGLRRYQVDVGHAEFFQGIMDAVKLPDDVKAAVRNALAARDFVALEELLERTTLRSAEHELLLRFPALRGGNLVSNIQLLQRLIPPMRDAGWGRIISIGSVQEISPSGEMPVYAMSKAAQENLVRNLAVQNARYGITVNNIAPGLVQTDRNAFRRKDPAAWEAIAKGANPMGRAGQPEDIAGAALFAALTWEGRAQQPGNRSKR
jgi:NAD(P)-dependent dehydrogenase (short-subunit alcohol dehydrogenase family)